MNPLISFDRCRSYIDCQLQTSSVPLVGQAEEAWPYRALTISRQAGSGAHAIAQLLLQRFQARTPGEVCPWTVFDRNLVEKVLEDHHLPGRLARFMPEDRISEIADTIDEVFGLHPSSWTLVRQTADTILRLVELGNVIIIGRGANLITARRDDVFHVRLVGSFEKRVQYVAELDRLTYRAAAERVRHEDLGRKRYLKKYFKKGTDDPLTYHLVINTDWVPFAYAAQMIFEAMTRRPAPREARPAGAG